ncbi:MAG: diacylglycerol/lipid kinase family protein [Vulcanimicrobiaceae bacterium]
MQEAVLVAGLESRSGAQGFEQAQVLLTQRGIQIVRAYLERDRARVRKRVRKAIKAGHRLICVAGGDGTQTSVVGLFAHTEAVLAVIPAGTGNSFALSLGIPGEVERAVAVIVDGQVAQVDLGKANDTYFANFATIGLASQIGNETPRGLKRILGPLAYAVASTGPILTHRPFRARVRWKDDRIDFQTHQMIVANGRYYGHEAIAPDANISDGKLAFFSTSGTNRIDILQTYLALMRGEQQKLSNAHSFSAKKIRIAAKPKQSVSIDGDYLCDTPVTFSVARRALRVMVPASFPEGAA